MAGWHSGHSIHYNTIVCSNSTACPKWPSVIGLDQSQPVVTRQQHGYSHGYHQAHLYLYQPGYIPSKPQVDYGRVQQVSMGMGILHRMSHVHELSIIYDQHRLLGCWGSNNTSPITSTQHDKSYQEHLQASQAQLQLQPHQELQQL